MFHVEAQLRVDLAHEPGRNVKFILLVSALRIDIRLKARRGCLKAGELQTPVNIAQRIDRGAAEIGVRDVYVPVLREKPSSSKSSRYMRSKISMTVFSMSSSMLSGSSVSRSESISVRNMWIVERTVL